MAPDGIPVQAWKRFEGDFQTAVGRFRDGVEGYRDAMAYFDALASKLSPEQRAAVAPITSRAKKTVKSLLGEFNEIKEDVGVLANALDEG